MRRWMTFLLALLAICLGGPAVSHAQTPPQDTATVVVQYASKRVQAQTEEGNPPSLEDQGYRTLAVPEGESPERFLQSLRADPDVLHAEFDAVAHAAAVPNDPLYTGSQELYLSKINVPAAWDLTTGSPAVVVAVLDTGTDLSHPDLAGRLWENANDADNDGIDDDGNGCVDDRYGCRFMDLTQARAQACSYTTEDRTGAVIDDHGRFGAPDHSHGTQVAGIIGAAGNNGQGVTGVAWNVKLMTVKVLDCGVFGQAPAGRLANVAQGIDYARRMGAQVINLSLSTPADPEFDIAVVRQAIRDAEQAGVIVVAATGNHSPASSNVGVGYPAAYTEYANVIAVGGSNLAGRWVPTSNYGPPVDFAAPEQGIATTVRTSVGFESAYGSVPDGTSFAAPLVTGMFALMAGRNPNLAMADYLKIARDAATPVEPAAHGQNWAGAGLINVGGAVERVPLSIGGVALLDWKDAPAGTEVRATVGGIDCGSTVVQAFGPIAQYALRVRPEAEQPGCGAPGRQVVFLIGSLAAQPAITWGGRDEPIGLTNRDILAVSPGPGATVVQPLNGAWSNVALLEPGGRLPNVLSNLASPWTQLLRWSPDKTVLADPGAYEHFSTGVPEYVNDLVNVSQYDPVWINAAAANMTANNPNPPPGRTVELRAGWNSVVYTGTTKSVPEALAGLEPRYTQVLQYDNAARAWRSYLPGRMRYLNDFGGMFQLQVYWIFMTEPGTLIMN
jgi:subtilisin family serine protease